MAFESQDDFFIAKLLVPAGAEIAVGSPIMVTVESADAVGAFANFVAPVASVVATSAAPIPAPVPVVTPVVATPAPLAPAPTPVAVTVPVVASAPVAAPVVVPVSTGTVPLAALYSVQYAENTKKKSPLFNKLVEERKKYDQLYGRSGHKA